MANANGIQGQGEALRRALRWLSEARLEQPQAPRLKLIEEAALRFDLTPAESDFLAMEWKEG
ncbi:MAG TPA: hypothetical protein VLT47_09990 [Anaeromyxobacteraceae bacterium]|nr:hypothetical protein [Anaeromyxobacteraceae bacterium]